MELAHDREADFVLGALKVGLLFTEILNGKMNKEVSVFHTYSALSTPWDPH